MANVDSQARDTNTSRVRKSSPEVVAQKRIAVASIEVETAKAELDAIVAFVDPNNPSERELEIAAIATKRVKIYEELEPVSRQAYEIARNGAGTQDEIEQYKAANARKQELYAQLDDLPELGATYVEWAQLTEEDKKKPMGRPPVPLELRLIRAVNEYNEAVSAYDQLCTELGIDAVPIQKIIDAYKRAPQFDLNRGRPSGGILSELDARICRIQRKIDDILSGREQEKIKAKEAKGIISTTGVRYGRKIQPLDERLERYQEEIRKLNEMVAEEEAALDPIDSLARQLHLVRKQIKAQAAYLVQSKISDDETSHPEVQKLMILEAKQYEIMDKRNALVKEKTAAERASAKHPTQEQLQEVARRVQSEKLSTKSKKVEQETEKSASRKAVNKRQVDESETARLLTTVSKRNRS